MIPRFHSGRSGFVLQIKLVEVLRQFEVHDRRFVVDVPGRQPNGNGPPGVSPIGMMFCTRDVPRRRHHEMHRVFKRIEDELFMQLDRLPRLGLRASRGAKS